MRTIRNKMKAMLLAPLIALGMIKVTEGKSAEEVIFEKPPYLTAAKAITAGDVDTLKQLIKDGLDVNYEGRDTWGPWGRDTVNLLLYASVQN